RLVVGCRRRLVFLSGPDLPLSRLCRGYLLRSGHGRAPARSPGRARRGVSARLLVLLPAQRCLLPVCPELPGALDPGIADAARPVTGESARDAMPQSGLDCPL